MCVEITTAGWSLRFYLTISLVKLVFKKTLNMAIQENYVNLSTQDQGISKESWTNETAMGFAC